MANEGFKGTRVGIESILVKGSRAHVDVQLMDEDGVVHAASHHQITLGEHEQLQTAAQVFVDVIANHITQLHFTRPTTDTHQEEAAHGIAETLRNGGTNVSDGFEEGG